MPGQHRAHALARSIIFMNFPAANLADKHISIALGNPERGSQPLGKRAEKGPAVRVAPHLVALNEKDVRAGCGVKGGGEGEGDDWLGQEFHWLSFSVWRVVGYHLCGGHSVFLSRTCFCSSIQRL